MAEEANRSQQESNHPSGNTNQSQTHTSYHTIPGRSNTNVTADRAMVKNVTGYLEDFFLIQKDQVHCRGWRRAVPLLLSEMYDKLCAIYAQIFKQYWTVFSRMAEVVAQKYDPDEGSLVLARSYIGGWFLDLYTSNRAATKLVAPEVYATYYSYDTPYRSLEYDQYLVLLNGIIRPTTILGTMEETMFVPHFGEGLWTILNNPFNITEWNFDNDTFMGVISLMKDRRLIFKMDMLRTTMSGRASWLLDWWEDNSEAYAFYPQEGNYSFDDVSLMYILGCACTDKLGPRDVEAWKDYPEGMSHALNPPEYYRNVSRYFYGAAEKALLERRKFARLVEQDDEGNVKGSLAFRMRIARLQEEKTAAPEEGELAAMDSGASSSLGKKKRKISIESLIKSGKIKFSFKQVESEQYRVTTFTYYCQLIRRSDNVSRVTALRMMILA